MSCVDTNGHLAPSNIFPTSPTKGEDYTTYPDSGFPAKSEPLLSSSSPPLVLNLNNHILTATDSELQISSLSGLKVSTASTNIFPFSRRFCRCDFNPTLSRIPYFNILWVHVADNSLVIDIALPASRLYCNSLSRLKLLRLRSFSNIYPVTNEQLALAINWSKALLARAYGHAQPRRRVFALINPHGGTGAARSLWSSHIEPLLNTARCTVLAMETCRPGHAAELVQNLDITAWDVIACCSGDGIVYEVFNGLARHPNAIDALKTIAVTQIPCGSGNAMSLNLNGTSSPDVATLALIKGVRTPFDLLSITQGSYRSLSFLSQSVGLIAESDLATEAYRWMGSHRFIYGLLVRLFRKTVYPCDIAVPNHALSDKTCIRKAYRSHCSNANEANLPYDEAEYRSEVEMNPLHHAKSSPKSFTSNQTKLTSPSFTVNPLSHITTQQQHSPTTSENGMSDNQDKSGTPASPFNPFSSTLPMLRYGTVQDPIPPDWTVLSCDHLLILYGGKMAYMAPSANFFPAALPHDGYIDLVCVQGPLSRRKALQAFRSVARGAEFFRIPDVKYFKLPAYRVIPRVKIPRERLPVRASTVLGLKCTNSTASPSLLDKNDGFISIDGERVAFEPFQVEVHPALGTVLSLYGERYEAAGP